MINEYDIIFEIVMGSIGEVHTSENIISSGLVETMVDLKKGLLVTLIIQTCITWVIGR